MRPAVLPSRSCFWCEDAIVSILPPVTSVEVSGLTVKEGGHWYHKYLVGVKEEKRREKLLTGGEGYSIIVRVQVQVRV